MPYQIRKVRGKNLYSVKNAITGVVHSKATTLNNAKAQVRLLNSLEGGAMKVGDVKTLLKSSYSKKSGDIDGFTLDKELSGKRVQVYTDADGKAYVVHRGTKGLPDVLTDIKMALGQTKSQKRFKHAKKIQQLAEQKYGAENVTTLGHSLGARIAEDVGKNSKEIITFNKPTLPMDLITKKKLPKSQFDIRTMLDPVSFLQPFQKGSADLIIPSRTLNPFAEHSTDALGRLEDERMIGSGGDEARRIRQEQMDMMEAERGDLPMRPLTDKEKDALRLTLLDDMIASFPDAKDVIEGKAKNPELETLIEEFYDLKNKVQQYPHVFYDEYGNMRDIYGEDDDDEDEDYSDESFVFDKGDDEEYEDEEEDEDMEEVTFPFRRMATGSGMIPNRLRVRDFQKRLLKQL